MNTAPFHRPTNQGPRHLLSTMKVSSSPVLGVQPAMATKFMKRRAPPTPCCCALAAAVSSELSTLAAHSGVVLSPVRASVSTSSPDGDGGCCCCCPPSWSRNFSRLLCPCGVVLAPVQVAAAVVAFALPAPATGTGVTVVGFNPLPPLAAAPADDASGLRPPCFCSPPTAMGCSGSPAGAVCTCHASEGTISVNVSSQSAPYVRPSGRRAFQTPLPSRTRFCSVTSSNHRSTRIHHAPARCCGCGGPARPWSPPAPR